MKLASQKTNDNRPTDACMICGRPTDKVCTGCHVAAYCSEKCQIMNWKTHETICKGACNSGFSSSSAARSSSKKGATVPRLGAGADDRDAGTLPPRRDRFIPPSPEEKRPKRQHRFIPEPSHVSPDQFAATAERFESRDFTEAQRKLIQVQTGMTPDEQLVFEAYVVEKEREAEESRQVFDRAAEALRQDAAWLDRSTAGVGWPVEIARIDALITDLRRNVGLDASYQTRAANAGRARTAEEVEPDTQYWILLERLVAAATANISKVYPEVEERREEVESQEAARSIYWHLQRQADTIAETEILYHRRRQGLSLSTAEKKKGSFGRGNVAAAVAGTAVGSTFIGAPLTQLQEQELRRLLNNPPREEELTRMDDDLFDAFMDAWRAKTGRPYVPSGDKDTPPPEAERRTRAFLWGYFRGNATSTADHAPAATQVTSLVATGGESTEFPVDMDEEFPERVMSRLDGSNVARIMGLLTVGFFGEWMLKNIAIQFTTVARAEAAQKHEEMLQVLNQVTKTELSARGLGDRPQESLKQILDSTLEEVNDILGAQERLQTISKVLAPHTKGTILPFTMDRNSVLLASGSQNISSVTTEAMTAQLFPGLGAFEYADSVGLTSQGMVAQLNDTTNFLVALDGRRMYRGGGVTQMDVLNALREQYQVVWDKMSSIFDETVSVVDRNKMYLMLRRQTDARVLDVIGNAGGLQLNPVLTAIKSALEKGQELQTQQVQELLNLAGQTLPVMQNTVEDLKAALDNTPMTAHLHRYYDGIMNFPKASLEFFWRQIHADLVELEAQSNTYFVLESRTVPLVDRNWWYWISWGSRLRQAIFYGAGWNRGAGVSTAVSLIIANVVVRGIAQQTEPGPEQEQRLSSLAEQFGLQRTFSRTIYARHGSSYNWKVSGAEDSVRKYTERRNRMSTWIRPYAQTATALSDFAISVHSSAALWSISFELCGVAYNSVAANMSICADWALSTAVDATSGTPVGVAVTGVQAGWALLKLTGLTGIAVGAGVKVVLPHMQQWLNNAYSSRRAAKAAVLGGFAIAAVPLLPVALTSISFFSQGWLGYSSVEVAASEESVTSAIALAEDITTNQVNNLVVVSNNLKNEVDAFRSSVQTQDIGEAASSVFSLFGAGEVINRMLSWVTDPLSIAIFQGVDLLSDVDFTLTVGTHIAAASAFGLSRRQRMPTSSTWCRPSITPITAPPLLSKHSKKSIESNKPPFKRQH